MPFKSEAQRRLFYAKAARGEISKEKVDEWQAATKKQGKKLPERVGEKKEADMVKKAFWKGFEKKAKSVAQILGAVARKKPLAALTGAPSRMIKAGSK